MNETQTREQWLASLKVGDQVAIPRGMSGEYRVVYVAEVTKQHIILSTREKYRRTNGKAVGADKWSSDYIEEVTPAVLAANKRRKLESAVWSELVKLQNINVVHSLSNERLEELLAVLKKQGE